jgi:hypothetical protein
MCFLVQKRLELITRLSAAFTKLPVVRGRGLLECSRALVLRLQAGERKALLYTQGLLLEMRQSIRDIRGLLR